MAHNVVVFSDSAVWTFMIQMMILAIAVVVGNVVRTKIPLIKKALVPSALLGGLIILILKMIPWFSNLISVEIMQMITYHCLGLGFVAMSLKTGSKSSKVPKIKVIENGCMTGASYMLQGIIGLVITIILYKTMGTFYAAGLIAPMGYGQGPGSALSWGSIYESSYGFSGGASFGLTIATVGFILASLVGVIYMNVLKSKGVLNVRTEMISTKSVNDFEHPNEIPTTESIDRFTVQVSLVLLAYFGSFLIMCAFQSSGIKVLQDLAWGLNFVWAIISAYILKFLIKLSKEKGIVSRNYTNDYLLERFSGCMFDLMIIAGVAAIKFEDISANWLTLLLICTFAAIGTFFFVLAVCKHLFKGYVYEMFVCNFGMLMGTVSNGMILLREIDPNYETPTANSQVMQNFPAIIFAAPVLLLMSFAAKSLESCYIVLAIFVVLFVLYCIFLFRSKVFGSRKKS